MQILDTPEAVRSLSESWRREGRLIGFVPTMGALHEGHLSLVRRAREECDRLFASIFVNPLQFEARDDLERYERPFDRDSRLLRETGCDALFAPSVEAMYGAPASGEGRLVQTFVEVKELGEILEGAVRPGHFRGVATIVAKLFNIGVPHRAYFGEKDYQQLKVIEQMVRDLFFDVELVPGPTVREKDGLALSRRNVVLHEEGTGARHGHVGPGLGQHHRQVGGLGLYREGYTYAEALEAAVLQVFVPDGVQDRRVTGGPVYLSVPIRGEGRVSYDGSALHDLLPNRRAPSRRLLTTLYCL